MQKKLERPAVGALPARAPARTPPPPPAKPRAAPAPAQAQAADGAPASIRCDLVSALTPELVANINAAFVVAAEMLAMRDPAQYDLMQAETLKAAMRYLLESQHVRQAPLLTALTTDKNPALLLKLPPSMTIKEIKSVRMNPEYRRPTWAVDRINAYRQHLEAAR